MTNYTKTTDFAAKDALPSGNSAKIVKGSEIDTEFNNIATASATKANANDAALTGTTTFETISDGTIAITGFVDEDNMVSDSATLLPTQQSVKAYVDSQVTAQDLDFQADTGGALSIDLDSESLTLTGGTGIDTSGLGNAVTFAIDSTVATLTGTQTLSNKTLSAPAVSGNLTTDGLIDGRDVATDGTKLDSIESGATADQTAAEIKTAYESNANTNAFTDADESKLDGIEALADVTDTANVTTAGALMDSELTSEASVKALNQGVATTDSPTFAGLTTTADVSFGDNDKAIFGAGSDLQIYHDGTSSTSYFIESNATGNMEFRASSLRLKEGDGGNYYFLGVAGGASTVYHNGSAKLATTATGIDVTGTVTADGLTVDGNASIGTSGTSVLDFERSGANYIRANNSGTGRLHLGAGGDLRLHTGQADNDFTENERIRISSNGDISFYNSAGTSQSLFWDASAESLGIGTSSPDYVLDVDDSSGNAYIAINRATQSQGEVGFKLGGGTSGDDWYIYQPTSSSNLSFYKTGDKVTIDSSGRVGIGTSSPAEELDISADAPSMQLSSTNASGRNYGLQSTNSGLFAFYDGTAGSNRMVIDSAGRLGIGTSSPSDLLDISANGTSAMRLSDSSTPATYAQITQANGVLTFAADAGNAQTGSNMQFEVDGTEAMRIDSSQQVGIGTSTPERLLHVKEDGTIIVGLFETASTVASRLALMDGNTTNNAKVGIGATGDTLGLYAGGSERVTVDDSGQVGIGTTSPTSLLTVEDSVNGRFTAATLFNNVNDGNTQVSIDFRDRNILSGGSPAVRLSSERNGVINEYSFVVETGDADSYLERFRVNYDGNVGIGTDSPNVLLELAANNNGSENNTLRITDTDTFVASGDTLGKLEFYATDGAAVKSFVKAEYANAQGDAELVLGTSSGASAATEAMRIDSSGNLLVGKTASGLNTAGFEVASSGRTRLTRDSANVVEVNRTTNDGSLVTFSKDGTSVGSIGSVGGTALSINSVGTGKLQANGSDRYAWDSSQFYPTDDNLRDLGFSTFRWDDVYATNGTIQTSDRNEKQDIEALSDAEQRVAVAAKGLLRKFRWISSVEENGDDARIHFGIIAQDLQAAFEAEGLDAGRYAMFINSTWTDEETGEERSRMGVRYSELLAFIIAAI